MLKQRNGQAYLEFVIVLPGLLLLLFLAWELAYFWWGRMVVSTGTFEAARQVAVGEPVAKGYSLYGEMLATGLGRMSANVRSGFTIAVQPSQRSVRASASVPWQWPSGLGALMGGNLNLSLKSSAFFRLEEFYPGPPDTFE